MQFATRYRILLSNLILFLCFQGFGQEVIIPLQMNAQLMNQKEIKGLKSSIPEYIDVDLDSTPYIILDDFSYNANVPDDHIWQGKSVYINRNFPIKPVSIGVATFDGLDEHGYPYNFITPTSYGPCDTLATLPIKLNKVDRKNDPPIYLSFFTQAQGLNPNANSPEDSLTLQFYQPYKYDTIIDGTVNPPDTSIDSTFVGRWIQIWGKEGYALGGDTACNAAFKAHTFKISPTLYQDSFQFRFISYGNTSGNIDHWHLDYVVLSSDPNSHDELGDYTFIDDVGSLIDTYESMPWFHYVGNESQFARDRRMTYKMRNTFSSSVTVDIEYRADDESGTEVDNIVGATPLSVGIPARACVLNQKMPDPSEPRHTFVFENSAVPDNGTTYFLKKTILRRRIGPVELIELNNQVENYQVFGSYYAYDDGSAEAGYGVKSDEGQVAVQFTLPENVEDTLTSVYIHFNPVIYDRSDEIFRLTVWDNNGNVPGDIIYENSSVSSPEYPAKGVNHFSRLYFEDPVIVSDTFYVGYQKITSEVMNIGYDLNKARNNKLYYNIGTGWQLSSASSSVPAGALMIRPSFRNVNEPVVGVEKIRPKTTETSFTLYPNPASNVLNIAFDDDNNSNWTVEVYDLEGRIVQRSTFTQQTNFDISSLTEGMYIVRMIDEHSNTLHAKFLVRR